MTYLIFDDTGEFIDVVDLDNENINKFKLNNPTLILKDGNDFDYLDEFFDDYDDDSIDE